MAPWWMFHNVGKVSAWIGMEIISMKSLLVEMLDGKAGKANAHLDRGANSECPCALDGFEEISERRRTLVKTCLKWRECLFLQPGNPRCTLLRLDST